MPNYIECHAHATSLGERNDCTVKAISIAGNVHYMEAHAALALRGRAEGKGCNGAVWAAAMSDLGLHWKEWKPVKPNGQGYTMKTIGRALPYGRHIVHVRGHVAALVDGVIEDWTSGRQHRVLRVLSLEGAPTEVEPPKRKSTNLNPQPVINAKKAAVAAVGGLLQYEQGSWVLWYGSRMIRVMDSKEFSQTTARELVNNVNE